MRTTTLDRAAASDSEELLTTGEAAAILACSRQHVVDLCSAGDLPYETVGTHRRVHRRDVEALRTRTTRQSRDQRRSRWLNTAVAGKLVGDPGSVLEVARHNLDRLLEQHQRGQAAHWLGEWRSILDGPIERILDALTSPTPWGQEMRQNSPFSGVLDDHERQQVLESFRTFEKAGR